MRASAERYSAVAIVLHWAIAVALLGNLLLGGWMHDAIAVEATQARAITAFQLHKSLGLTILLLSLIRLLWRWLNPPPPLPATMPGWEKLAARATHWAFYALMLGLPLSGWLYVSTQWRNDTPLNVPTLWFGLFEVPHLFGLNEATRELRQSYAGMTLEAHEWLAGSMGALLVLHVLAALKHHFYNRDAVLAHMIPALARSGQMPAPRDGRRSFVFAAGFAAVLGGAAFMTWALFGPTPSAAVGESEISSSPESNWIVDPARSEVSFSGTHAGVAFRGRFKRWQADIRFDPANLADARINGSFETASATDGVPLHDESLPQTEWFDSAAHPQANFRSTGITPREDGSYAVNGVLTIKQRNLPLVPLTLSVADGLATITGRFEVDRSEADLGMESDPDAQYVSRKIAVEVHIEAQRRQ